MIISPRLGVRLYEALKLALAELDALADPDSASRSEAKTQGPLRFLGLHLCPCGASQEFSGWRQIGQVLPAVLGQPVSTLGVMLDQPPALQPGQHTD